MTLPLVGPQSNRIMGMHNDLAYDRASTWAFDLAP